MYLQLEERERGDEARIFFLASCLSEGDLMQSSPLKILSFILYYYFINGTNLLTKSLNW